MKSLRIAILVSLLSLCAFAFGQIDKIAIAAGTPEDKDLNAISNEQDPQKRIPMYQDFLQKYASNPVAVAYGNWQLAESYQGAGDLQKAIECGDQAAAAAPHNLDILTSVVTIAQQAKDNPRMFKYSVQGGDAYDSIDKQTKPADMSDQQFAANISSEKEANKSTFEFFQNAAFSAIAAETDAKTRMDDIDKFGATFPGSKLNDQLTSYAILSLSELKDNKRLVAYANKALAGNPDNLPALLTLANAYVNSSEPGSLAKAATYAQSAIVAAKADAPDADASRKVSAGVAHSTLGQVYAKQEKTASSITELKSAIALLKGQDEQQFAVAAYFLGWDYAKLNKLTDARAVLNEALAIPGPMQGPVKELLTKVNSARAAGR
jgi:tetratricopeptide (TPR) repeat protein